MRYRYLYDRAGSVFFSEQQSDDEQTAMIAKMVRIAHGASEVLPVRRIVCAHAAMVSASEMRPRATVQTVPRPPAATDAAMAARTHAIVHKIVVKNQHHLL